MGDTLGEIGTGINVAKQMLPLIEQMFESFRFLLQRGVPPDQARSMLEAHITAGQSNAELLGPQAK